jgi:hypothetical protein
MNFFSLNVVETSHLFARMAPLSYAVRRLGRFRRKMGHGSLDFYFLEQFRSRIYVLLLLYVCFGQRNVVEGKF